MAQDIPFDEACRQAEGLIARGHDVYQKFTCAGCGNRLTMETKNRFFVEGTCDHCPAVTNIRAQGCGFTLHAHPATDPGIIAEIIRRGR
jgi:hypothetical protein